MNTICVASQAIETKEWQGQRVITLTDVDKVHQRPEETARRNFRINKKRFIKGEDYFEISPDEIRRNKVMTVSPMLKRAMIFLTEMGYLMLVKSFTDDLAWTVQRALVQNYFRAEKLTTTSALSERLTTADIQRKTLGGIPVMVAKDLMILTGLHSNTIFNTAQKANMHSVVITGKYLADLKEENPHCIYPSTPSLTIYYEHDVKELLTILGKMEAHRDFVEEYFMPDYNQNMSLEEMRVAIEQAKTIYNIAVHWQGDKQKCWLFEFATTILINIGLWNEKRYGYNGVTDKWDTNSMEGCNKKVALLDGINHFLY